MEKWEAAFEAWYQKTQPEVEYKSNLKEAWLACWAFCRVMYEEDFSVALEVVIHGKDGDSIS